MGGAGEEAPVGRACGEEAPMGGACGEEAPVGGACGENERELSAKQSRPIPRGDRGRRQRLNSGGEDCWEEGRRGEESEGGRLQLGQNITLYSYSILEQLRKGPQKTVALCSKLSTR